MLLANAILLSVDDLGRRSFPLTDLRRSAIRATQNCLTTNAFALLLLPFAASRFSEVL